jgi:hypothetical protein
VEYIGEPGSIRLERYTTRPAAEIVGWRAVCNCRRSESSRVTDTWASDLVTRVPSKALEDEAAGRIYVVDQDVMSVDDDFHDMFVGIWRREHVDGDRALEAIGRARDAVRNAERDLDDAVGAARAAGESWEAIGRAAGMTRQSAHGRWSSSPLRDDA